MVISREFFGMFFDCFLGRLRSNNFLHRLNEHSPNAGKIEIGWNMGNWESIFLKKREEVFAINDVALYEAFRKILQGGALSLIKQEMQFNAAFVNVASRNLGPLNF